MPCDRCIQYGPDLDNLVKHPPEKCPEREDPMADPTDRDRDHSQARALAQSIVGEIMTAAEEGYASTIEHKDLLLSGWTADLEQFRAQARREGREEEKSHCGHHFDLRAADALARAVDDAVKEGHIDARSRIADARLDYGEPFKYEHTPPAPEGEKP